MDRVSKILRSQFTFAVIAIFIGFLVAALVLGATGYNPLEVYSILFKGMFSKPRYIMNIIIKASPIILTGISFAFALRVGLFNIGVEGQYIVGTIAAAVVGILFDFPSYIQFPLVLLAGTLAGGLYGAISGLLKAKRGIHEVITGIMFNWIAFYAGNYIVNLERFHEPGTTTTYQINASGLDPIYNWKMSEAGLEVIRNNEFIREVIGKTSANIGIIIAIIVALTIHFILKNTTIGYELRAVGMNKHASEAAGINVAKNTIQTFLIAGAIAGLSGALSITGVSHRLFELMAQENYGFNGLSVALMAGGSPIGCIFAGLLFAGLTYGGGTIQLEIGAPSEIIDILIGTIVFCMALVSLIPLIINKINQRGGKKDVK
ncbi:MAG: ABC transporter permease [Tissierellia bacterium]|nr:ABC transporter permease [Tissierellia bacterium]